MRWYDLQDLLPPVYAGVQSMYETAVTENEELKAAYAVRDAIFANFFVQTCDIPTLQYWEQLLDIELYGGETPDERRATILLYLVNNWQITKPFVEYRMEQFFGEGNYSFDYSSTNNLVVDIRMYDANYNSIRRFLKWFEKVCTAHVQWHAHDYLRADGTNYITPLSLTHETAYSSASMSMGNGTLYLGQTSYPADWMIL